MQNLISHWIKGLTVCDKIYNLERYSYTLFCWTWKLELLLCDILCPFQIESIIYYLSADHFQHITKSWDWRRKVKIVLSILAWLLQSRTLESSI